MCFPSGKQCVLRDHESNKGKIFLLSQKLGRVVRATENSNCRGVVRRCGAVARGRAREASRLAVPVRGAPLHGAYANRMRRPYGTCSLHSPRVHRQSSDDSQADVVVTSSHPGVTARGRTTLAIASPVVTWPGVRRSSCVRCTYVAVLRLNACRFDVFGS